MVLTVVGLGACHARLPDPPSGPRDDTRPGQVAVAPTLAKQGAAEVSSTAAGSPDLEGVPVGASVDAAIAEVVSWLDPDRQPRIDAVRFVLPRDVEEACPDGVFTVHDDVGWTKPDIAELPRGMIHVQASQQGIDSALDPANWDDRVPFPERERERIAVLLDAETGDVVVAAPIAAGGGFQDEPCLEGLPGRARLPGTPRPPAPSATAHPYALTAVAGVAADDHLPVLEGAAPLRPDTVPSAMRAILRGYPVFAGNRWVWRRTMRINDIRWYSVRYTETVTAAWVVHPDLVAADFELDVRWMTPPFLPEERLLRRYRRFLTPRWSMIRGDPPDRERLAYNPASATIPPNIPQAAYAPAEMPIESIRTAGLPPFWPPQDDIVVHLREAPELTGVGVANALGPCWTFDTFGGHSWDSARWFCPGVGYVRGEFSDGGQSGTDFIVLALESFDLPTMLSDD